MQNRFSSLPLDSVSLSPKDLFLVMSREHNATKEPMMIRAPKFRPCDYKIFINIFRGDGGQALLSKCLDGESIPSFFEEGRIELYEYDINFFHGDNWLDLNLTVHIYRVIDHKVLLFFRGKCEDPDVDGAWFPSEKNLEMRDYNYARCLDKEISSLYEFLSGLKVDVFISTSESECNHGTYLEPGSIEIATELNFDDDFEPFPKGKVVTFAHYLEELYGWT
jgi:hypothetical protein